MVGLEVRFVGLASTAFGNTRALEVHNMLVIEALIIVFSQPDPRHSSVPSMTRSTSSNKPSSSNTKSCKAEVLWPWPDAKMLRLSGIQVISLKTGGYQRNLIWPRPLDVGSSKVVCGCRRRMGGN